MSYKKETLVKLSTISHVCVAVILCHLTPTFIERILVLVCFGVMGGIQAICINKIENKSDEAQGDAKTGDGSLVDKN